jgi:aminoglycoside phosphotransferase (APT) family kinase protein
MERWFARRAAGGEAAVKVLRYVPLRRFTFRMREADGREAIGKFKRRSRYRQAWDLLVRVERAVAAAGAPFRVSAPLWLDDEHALYAQSVLSGEDLSGKLDAGNHTGLMRRVGALHRALHGVALEGLPRVEPAAWLEEARQNVRWIGWFEPGHALALADAIQRLARRITGIAAHRPVFCHGDFVCSQILADRDDWAITDFDLSHLGDPYRDLAILLASLTYDVPLYRSASASGASGGLALIEAATEAYLAGYERALGEPIDRQRLAWHRACAEIYYLALMLKKDRFDRSAFERGAALALNLAAAAD